MNNKENQNPMTTANVPTQDNLQEHTKPDETTAEISLRNYFTHRPTTRNSSLAVQITLIVLMLLTFVMILLFKDSFGETISRYLFGRTSAPPSVSTPAK